MNAKNTDFGSFAQDVMLGLNSTPKTLPSKYFYDSKGDKLFQQIMALPEYYLTRKEYEILELQHEQILEQILASSQPFNLVELGAGDGMKTKILLRYLTEKKVEFTYYPVDFSGSVLEELEVSLANELPELVVKPLQDTYRVSLKKQVWEDGRPNLILFMGANLGNFGVEEAKNIIDHLRVGTKKGDLVLLGFDLKKNPQTILSAYHDEQGVTREFNMNLLDRINRELDANFERDSFVHWPTYDPVSGECRSYLVSLKTQDVTIGALNQIFKFEAFESIFTEISKKYSLSEISYLASLGGFEVKENFMDSEGYFADVLWEKK
ncbi:dimethylhistidine N-methyltransferase [Algoriphagus ratkowskyi]|uniref:Dimethylhistidine N-methyltransferase n=1 Tax=Algoriphagus ratkowskyi TaxID=57028 RepID=A0A2W7R3J0_9BACT|nr:L-histidine N(alpha)-methyltransferase [Algoriphagus ratkowskyi]PZX55383.1 dimethylhistidine N-methyltransferase [Algoriphagus ratkowskyi]TXD79689.1 L-histidine N(alpha)-methyltransferase [Algoriphagus ratkowskyi]